MIVGVANATDWFETITNNAFNAALELGQNVWETGVGYVKQTWDSLRNGDWEGFANFLVNSVTLGGWDATIEGMNRRYAEYQKNPSVYNTLNRFSLGLVDTFGRVFSPESYGIEANSVEHWQAFYGALLTEAFVLKTVKITSASIENAITDPHSPAGLSNVANSPENVVMSQAAMQNSSASAHGSATTVRVGRWMSVEEYQKMVETGKVQVPYGDPTSYVAYPADVNAYRSQAKPGTIYVEFDVDVGAIQRAGNTGWAQIPGPGSLMTVCIKGRGCPQ